MFACRQSACKMSAEGAGSKIPVFQFSALPLADKVCGTNVNLTVYTIYQAVSLPPPDCGRQGEHAVQSANAMLLLYQV